MLNKLILVLFLTFTSLTYAGTPQWEFVMKHKGRCPGWQQEGQCKPFALMLYDKMSAAGFKPKLVLWQWSFREESGKILYGAHLAIAYETVDGIWIQDNMTLAPVWVDKHENLSWHTRVSRFVAAAYRMPEIRTDWNRPEGLKITPIFNVTPLDPSVILKLHEAQKGK